jgi:predicted amidohydrolase YtcJ
MSQLAIVNGMIWDAERAPFLGSVVCTGGTITSVVAGMPDALGPEVEVIDARGGSIIPAFTDCHMHFSGAVRSSHAVDLADTKSLDHAVRLLLERAKASGPDDWVIGVNMNENAWPERRLPTRDDLDAIANPVMVQRVCIHKNCINTRALAMVGEAVYDAVAGGLRDARGRLTGVLEEDAAVPVARAMRGGRDKAEDWLCYMDGVLAFGVAEVHAVGTRKVIMEENVALYEKLRATGKLPIRFRFYWNSLPKRAVPSGAGDDWLAYGGLKVFVDGAYGARTAALREPYADAPHRGMMIHSDEELYGLLRAAFERDLQVMAHCLGDRALDAMLDQIERLNAEGISSKWPIKFTHVELCHPDQFERMARVNGFCDVQPCQLVSDAPYLETIIGSARKQQCFAFRSMIDAGLTLAGSSDAPVESTNPLTGIKAAVMREPTMNLAERITFEEGLKMYTINPQMMVRNDHRKGLLKEGYVADIAVFERNLFDVEMEALPDCRVMATIVDGRVRFRRTA